MQDTLTPNPGTETQDPKLTSLVDADELQKEGFTNEADQAPASAPATEMTTQDKVDVAKLSEHVVDLSGKAPEVTGSLDQAAPEVRTAAVESSTPSTGEVLEDQKGDRVAALREQIAQTPGDKATVEAAHEEYAEGRKEDLMAQRKEEPKGGSLVDRFNNWRQRRAEAKKGGGEA